MNDQTADPFLHWGAVVVPWSAAWSTEVGTDASFIRTERLDGIDVRFLCDGVEAPGVGKPLFKTLHNARSRDLIRNRLCQLCKTHLPGGGICMNQGENHGLYPLINDGLPMCDPCAVLALAQCPGLQRAAAGGKLRLWRASHWLHAPVLLGVVPEERGGNPIINALLERERGRVFSGIKLVLTRFRSVDPKELAA